MKTHLSFAFAIFFATQMAWAANITAPSDIPEYYASVNNKSGDNLFTAVGAIAAKNRHSLGYNGLYEAYKKTDIYPQDSVGKAGRVWDMYSDCGFVFGNTCGQYSKECDCYNREHSIPKSWFGGTTSGIGCDIFHVVPTDGKVNGMRSAYIYGEISGRVEYISKMGHRKGSGGAVLNERKTICAAAGSSTPCSTGTVFEPIDRYKGDLARGIMGTMLSWRLDMTQAEGSKFFQSTYTKNSNFGLTAYGVAVLMKWHRQDPVSKKEIDRNNGIQATQGNRNPFIDYPYLAEYIWGEHAGETVDMSQLISSSDPNFVPGVSNGWRGQPVGPDQPIVKYGVSWSVNGEIIQTDSIRENNRVLEMPETPQSCSTESDEFIGWTNAPIDSVTDIVPAVLYRELQDIPPVTADMTLYAVFAKSKIEGATEPKIYIYDADHQEGWQNSAQPGSYWLLNASSELISPEIDLAGLESISMVMRTYGGIDNNTVTIHANDQKIGQLEAVNSSLAEQTWRNNQQLSGIAAIHFKADYTGRAGVGFTQVTINATGAAVVYERFITSCQSSQELDIDNISSGTAARKLLIGGHIYVQIGESLYTITGQRIQ